MSDDPIDLTNEVEALCKKLGQEARNVFRIEIKAGGFASPVVLSVFKTDSEGRKYVDTATGAAAAETLRFEAIV